MFDYHMHTTVSFDGHGSPQGMALAALQAGIKEICFTDHLDYGPPEDKRILTFTTEDYNRAYDNLSVPGILIRRGFEFGMTPDNQEQLKKDLARRPFDFVIGSVHFVDGIDPYYPEYWNGHTVKEAFQLYLEEVLKCVKVHDDYDVLGHLTYPAKTPDNPHHDPLLYEDFPELFDEILSEIVKKDMGLEINTSGVDRIGHFLPDRDILLRFYELGGRIVTVGSDAHDASRVGQYTDVAEALAREIFGYVCTFENRKPIFHR